MKPGQHRETARVLLRKPSGEIFLLLTHFDPEVGLPPRWLTPGGGIDEGETPLEAAIRELSEETGLIVSPELLEGPLWRFEGRWEWADGVNHHSFVDHVFLHTVEDFEVDDSSWTANERRDILQHRWWKVDELIESREPVSPPGLLQALGSHRF